MTDKELIKQEIENLKAKVDDESSYSNGWKQAIRAIEIFIDSLPENNKPIWHDSNEFPIKGELFLYETNQNIVDLIRSNGKEMPDWCNRWAYLDDLLKIDSLPEKFGCEIDFTTKSKDLEKEIENYINDSLAIKFPTTDKEQIKADIRYIARHFAEWQKQKSMQDFMEKAIEHLEPKILSLLSGDKQDTNKFIEDFKNYMKNDIL